MKLPLAGAARLALAIALVAGIGSVATPMVFAADSEATTDAESTLARLWSDFQKAPAADLTARRAILDLMQPKAAGTKFAGLVASARATIDATQASAEQALASANRLATEGDLAKALDQCRPFAAYFSDDTTLYRSFRYSSVANRITIATRDAIRVGNFAEADRLKAKLEHFKLAKPTADSVREGQRQGCDSILRASLQQAPDLDRHAAFSVLLLEDSVHNPLRVGILLDAAETDQGIATLLAQNLERRWGGKLALSIYFSRDELDRAPIDLFLAIDLKPIRNEITRAETTVVSSVPGKVTRKENPEFVKALEAYEDADRTYKEEIERYYEYDYKQYLERVKEAENMAKRTVIENNNIDIGGDPAALEENSAAMILLENDPKTAIPLELEKQKMVRLLNLDQQPEMPEPPHERLLIALNKTPTTIVVKEDDIPYQYLSERIESKLEATATISIADKSTLAVTRNDPVVVEHASSWHRNIGARSSDPNVISGNYSDDALRSAERMFTLQFASQCIDQMQASIGKTAGQLFRDASKRKDTAAIGFASAIALSFQRADQRSLSIDERLALAKAISATSDPAAIASIWTEVAQRKAAISTDDDSSRNAATKPGNQNLVTEFNAANATAIVDAAKDES